MKENLKVVGFVVAVVVAVVAFSLGTRWMVDNIPQGKPNPANLTEESSCAAITPTSTITPTPTSTPAPTFAPDLETSAAVVEQGVEVLFTVDSRYGLNTWVTNLCAISPGACGMQWSYQYEIEEGISQHPTSKQTCEARALRMVSDDHQLSKNSYEECWIVEYTTSGWEEPETRLIFACAQHWTDSGEYEFHGVSSPDTPQSVLQDVLENGY